MNIGSRTISKGRATRLMALAICAVFLSTSAAPFASGATTVIFVSPTPSKTVKGTIDVEVKMDTAPTSVGLFIDGIYFTDMTYSGYDLSHWHYKYTLDTWGLRDGSHLLRVEVREVTGNTSKGINFFVDNYSPLLSDLEVKYPYNQMAAKKGDRITVTARASDGVTGIKEIYCDATKVLAQNSIPMYDDGQHNDSSEGDHIYGTDPIAVGALTNGYNILYVWAVDGMGNEAMGSLPVAMDNTPPRVIESIVEYPVGQSAAKLGDDIRIVSTVEDKGEGGMLRLGTDIVLVLDNSGSMINGMDPAMNYLKEAVNKFVELSHPEDRIAIYAFADKGYNTWETPDIYLPFTAMDSSGKAAVASVLNDDWEFNRAHNTPIWDTIGEAIKYSIKDSTRQSVVVAITDGTDYGYDWYERPDPDWWKDAYDWGYTGLGFERGSEYYAPWNDWGTTVFYEYHYGEYPAPWPDDDEVHWFDVPIPDDPYGFDYSQMGMPEDRDESTGLRMGLLNAPVPVFTIGLGLPHHSPMMESTTEWDLYKISTTSANESIRGKYYYAPSSGDLNDIYEDISFFINLAGDINITPPGGLRKFTMDATVLGQEVIKPLHDDGDHNDIYPEDETFGTVMFDVKTDVTRVVNVTLDAEDIVGHEADTKVEVLIDNTLPVIEDLVPHMLDPEGMNEVKRHYVSDGDMVFFTVNASDNGEVRGLTRIALDASVIGGDKEHPMLDDGEGYDRYRGDGVFTSRNITVLTGMTDGIIHPTATAHDVALNKATVIGDLLVLNALDIEGQIIEPHNGSYVKGTKEVRLTVNDDTNVVGATLYIWAILPSGGPIEPTEMMMVWDSAQGHFKVLWNTTGFDDGAYELSGKVFTKAETVVQVPMITVFVDNTPPEVEILAPEDESIIAQVTRVQVLAKDSSTTSDGKDLVRTVDISIGDQVYQPMVRKPDGQPGVYNFYLDLDPTYMKDGVYVIMVMATDMAGWQAFDNITVYIDTLSPIITPAYIPPTDSNISLDFNFGFMAEDTSGIDRAIIRFDGKSDREYALPRNGENGLWEYELDTTKLKDGNHTYCVKFWDKVGLESEYCSNFMVDNTGAKPPKKKSDIWEMPWWVILILAIAIGLMVLALVLMARDRYWKQQAEEELAERLGKEDMERELAEADKEEMSASTVPLPPPLPPVVAEARPRSRKGRKKYDAASEEADIRVPVDVEDRKGAPKDKGTLELSELAPAVVAKAGLERPTDKGPDEERPTKRGEGKGKAKKRFVRCPMCRSKISVTSDERPLVISCGTCGAKGRLK